MLRRNVCDGAAFYTRAPFGACGKVAGPRKIEQIRHVPPVQMPFKRNGFLRICLNLDGCASLAGVALGRVNAFDREGSRSVRIFATQQLALLTTAAAFLFVGAIIAGLI